MSENSIRSTGAWFTWPERQHTDAGDVRKNHPRRCGRRSIASFW